MFRQLIPTTSSWLPGFPLKVVNGKFGIPNDERRIPNDPPSLKLPPLQKLWRTWLATKDHKGRKERCVFERKFLCDPSWLKGAGPITGRCFRANHDGRRLTANRDVRRPTANRGVRRLSPSRDGRPCSAEP